MDEDNDVSDDPNDDPDSVFNNAIMITFGYGFGGRY